MERVTVPRLGLGRAIAYYIEGFDIRPNGRDRCCCYDIAGGAPRRRQKPGLALLLAAGRNIHPLGLDASRILWRRAWRDWLVRAVAGSPKQVGIV
jgi:hypothetical protein